ncbi:CCA tRNA nucleotidyltransferase [[Clostridium] colinum]|uniref:CCA tRNA nucleotidyltransferase n=1 Tax=[Clostridium] colinum TaxID=36835 RepID=UPI002024A458|nr:CCA tRNA nucleotidyltransferase [[Clostridium] colinum]
MQIPKQVIYIMEQLEKNGFESFIVGGCVRDYVLGFSPKDFDITTDAMPLDIKNIFEHTIDTGIEHGTVTIVLDRQNFEVTTYRIDGEYKDNRRPENVVFTKKIDEDLSRRDFTMNAIAYNVKKGFVDPFGGREDIKNKIIKGVGDADKRFKEDALRMMRGVRFSAQLGFDIEEKTFLAIKKNNNLIENISIERTRDEFLKLIKSDYIEKLELLKQTNLYKYFIPEIEPIFDNYKKNIFILKKLSKNLRLAFLLSHLDENTGENILKRLKMDNKTIKEIKTILRYFNYNFVDDRIETRKIMSVIEPDLFKNILEIKFCTSLIENDLIQCKKYDNIYDEIDETIRKNHCFSLKTLAITGNDLKQIGITDGKKIGDSLKKALNIVLEEPNKNDKDFLLKYIGDNI